MFIKAKKRGIRSKQQSVSKSNIHIYKQQEK